MEWEWWERAIVAGVVVVIALAVARLADRALGRRLRLTPEALTRYRVVRRSVVAGIIFVGVLSALLVIPAIRAVAGSILASSAIAALIIGFAAQSTLANFVAGLLIAFTQPLRLGDQVAVGGATGTVEEVGLTYTRIRGGDGACFFVPNAKLASDTIRNSTFGSSGHQARVSLTVPLSTDLDWVLEMLADEARATQQIISEREPVATLGRLEAASAEVAVEVWAHTANDAAKVAESIRRAAYRRLREQGAFA